MDAKEAGQRAREREKASVVATVEESELGTAIMAAVDLGWFSVETSPIQHPEAYALAREPVWRKRLRQAGYQSYCKRVRQPPHGAFDSVVISWYPQRWRRLLTALKAVVSHPAAKGYAVAIAAAAVVVVLIVLVALGNEVATWIMGTIMLIVVSAYWLMLLLVVVLWVVLWVVKLFRKDL